VAILRQISGTDLDPQLVKAFICDIKKNGLATISTHFMSLYSPIFSR
jgi:hypothetical protein